MSWEPEVTPSEAGFDPERLRRLDEHFAQYVDDGRLPGWLMLVARNGRIAHLSTYGHRNVETREPVENDTLFRIHSMTKPMTSVAVMMLYEQGLLELTDPVSRFIPSFADLRVYTGGTAKKVETRPAIEPMRIWHLLTHTSGLTYGFHYVHPVDQMYRDAGFEFGMAPGLDLEGCCDLWASLPLMFDPGHAWNYSVSTDVLGRIIEVASGQTLDEFFRTRLLQPLGMHDTSFRPDSANAERLAGLYVADSTGHARRPHTPSFAEPTKAFSGGGGLVSTAQDYHRFMRMLLGGGELDGTRVLGNRTLRFMARNHLPGDADLSQVALGAWSEVANAGKGFGLGFTVVRDPAASKVIGSAGELSWGGLASTAFWVDPVEDLSVLFMTQLIPSGSHPIKPQMRQLVYQALVD